MKKNPQINVAVKELILADSRPILRKPPDLCYKNYFFCYCITVYVGVLMYYNLFVTDYHNSNIDALV